MLATPLAAQSLAKVGPQDPVTGYPLFYEDSNGLRLGICTDPNACFFALPNPGLPLHFPAFPGDPAENYPDEGFYWAAQADMTGVVGARASLTLALESAFFNGSVAIGDNMVFARVRIRITGLVNGASYTITHPYGTEVLVAGVDGPLPGTINVTHDGGITGPMEFTGVLNGGIGPFLTPTSFVGPGFPGQFIADGATETLVTGSPFATNYFRIQGPSANTLFPANAAGVGRAQINTFIMQGQVAPQVGAGIDKVSVGSSATDLAVNIWASTAAGQILEASVAGIPGVPMLAGADGSYFARIVFPAGTPLPSLVSVTNLTDFPATTFSSSLVKDTVTVDGAVFTIGGNLLIHARTTDKVGNPAMTATAGGASLLLTSLGDGVAEGTMPFLPGAVPPKTVTVESAGGGIGKADVVVEGSGAQGSGVPLVAAAGADQNVASGANVSLSGLTSQGNITSFSWSHDAGASIFLQNANTATPSFVAPVVGVNQQVDITLTLVVNDGFASAVDTVVVHVHGPVGPPDVITITDARYTVGKPSWRVVGSNSLHQGQTVRIYLGQVGNRDRQLGQVTVAANGTWQLFTPASGALVPLATDTTIWAESNLVGPQVIQTFRRQ